MTTPATVRAAWNTAIWSNAAAIAITPNIYDTPYAVLSATELSPLYDKSIRAIHFFEYIVSRAEKLELSRSGTRIYPVTINYYREVRIGGADQFNTVIDNMVTICDLVLTQLGHTWSGTVSYYQQQSNPIEPSVVTIDSKPVYRASYRYEGVQNF